MGGFMDELRIKYSNEMKQGQLSSFNLLFQFIFGLAFVSGVYNFFTDGSGTSLRAWTSYSYIDIAKFAFFFIESILFVMANSVFIQILVSFRKEFGLRQSRIIFDLFFTTLESLAFVLLSLTLSPKANFID